jgi:hypothetical protein
VGKAEKYRSVRRAAVGIALFVAALFLLAARCYQTQQPSIGLTVQPV